MPAWFCAPSKTQVPVSKTRSRDKRIRTSLKILWSRLRRAKAPRLMLGLIDRNLVVVDAEAVPLRIAVNKEPALQEFVR